MNKEICEKCGKRLDDKGFCECCGNQEGLMNPKTAKPQNHSQQKQSFPFHGNDNPSNYELKTDTSLSENRILDEDMNGEFVYTETKVKEFIKKLKEEDVYRCGTMSEFHRKINKLAGKDLI